MSSHHMSYNMILVVCIYQYVWKFEKDFKSTISAKINVCRIISGYYLFISTTSSVILSTHKFNKFSIISHSLQYMK